VNFIKALIDRRIELEFLKNSEIENVIFCRPFEDNLRNICLFQTKNRDFIHKYVFEGSERFIITDIILEDGSCFKNVKFKLVVVNDDNVPQCSLNLLTLNEETKTFVPIKDKKEIIIEKIEEKEPPKSSTVVEVSENVPDYTSIIEKVNFIEREKRVFEENQKVSRRLESHKQDIVSEILYALLINKNEKNRQTTKKIVEESVRNESKALKYFFAEYLKKEASDFKKLISEIYDGYIEKFPEINNNIDSAAQKLDQIIREQKELSKAKENIFKELKEYINTSVRQYSQRILELGSGGGTNAVQYYNGGNIYGDIFIEGDIHANNFDSLFSTVQTNSAFWSGNESPIYDSTYTTVLTLSSGWQSSYTTVKQLSANWETAYDQIDKVESIINYLSGQIDLNVFQNINSNYETLLDFTRNSHPNVYNGYTVTMLNNKRVYIFAGNDQNNPNHYIELNANPHKPIYFEVPLSADGHIIDAFDLSDFRSAKYTIQIQTDYNSDIYYSEINVVGTAVGSQAVASEYGQIATNTLIDEYKAYVSTGKVYLSAAFLNPIGDPNKKYIIKGLRTNFYKI